MTLLKLHNEILLALIPFCPDRTLINLSLTCQRLRDLFKSALKHREQLQRWTEIRFSDVYTALDTPLWNHPIEVIAKFRENPHVADYVRLIQYSPHEPGSWRENAEDEEESNGAEILEPVEESLRSCNYLEDDINAFNFLNDEEKRTWKEAVRNLEPDPCFMVMFSLCKRTKQLEMTDTHDMNLSYFNSVVNHMRDEEMKAPGKYKETGVLGHFPAVTKAHIEHWDTEGGMDFGSAWQPLRIPSLRVFDGNMLGDEYSAEDPQWPDGLAECSNLERISIDNTLLNPSGIVEGIRRLPRLKEFVLSGRYVFEDPGEDEDWDGIHEYVELLRQQGETLFKERSLSANVEMYKDPENPGPYGSYEAVVVRKLESS